MKSIIELAKLLIPAFLIAIVGWTFLFQAFNIPSGSLIPSLLVGDYLFVSKYAYGYSKYSIPFKPIPFAGRIWGALPKLGDIAVFKYPCDNSTDYIKRVIGLPGDKIAMNNETLSINGVAAKLQFVREYADDQTDRRAFVYEETLPNGVRHLIQVLDHPAKTSVPGHEHTWSVAPGTVFMMGDNRDDSSDSRFWACGSGLPVENLVGRAEVIFLSMKTIPNSQRLSPDEEPKTEPVWQFWRWPSTVRWDRLLTRIH